MTTSPTRTDRATADRLHRDAVTIWTSACAAVHPRAVIPRAVRSLLTADVLRESQTALVIAAGKAAEPAWEAWCAQAPITSTLAVLTRLRADTDTTEPASEPAPTFLAAHPLPDRGSVAAGRAALAAVRAMRAHEVAVLLLSGGASSMLSAPWLGDAVPDEDALRVKRHVSHALMRAGAKIADLNAVRIALSSIKGGGLKRAAQGRIVTLAISDVCGETEDVLGLIGSGPGIAAGVDASQTDEILKRYGVWETLDGSVRARIEQSPPRLESEGVPDVGVVIASRRDAMAGAKRMAESLGYDTVVLDEPVVGDARASARTWWQAVGRRWSARTEQTGWCLISSGETTMRVTGDGRGGRNQEFALAVALAMEAHPLDGAGVLSAGTDGIDGQSPAAGAWVDVSTTRRAAEAGIDVTRVQALNDTFRLFDALGDALVTGSTGTNVGDLQIALVPARI